MEIILDVPQIYRRGSLQADQVASVNSGLNIVKLVDSYKSVKNAKIIDFGCGVKIPQALRQLGDPHKEYYGLDVYEKMIDYLVDALADNDKYELATVKFQNNMYNKNGSPMTAESQLPIPNVKADILTMFSVVTHMTPDDTFAILSILKKYAAKDARLIFSAFSKHNQEEDFIDLEPDRPLLRAIYNRDFLVGIIERAGWKILSEEKPIRHVIQHHFVCELAD